MLKSFKSHYLFMILLILVAGRSLYYGFDWQVGLSLFVLGSLFTVSEFVTQFFSAKKEVLSENSFRVNIVKEVESLKSQMSSVKLHQSNFLGKR